MENASKALIIAGAILLSILIIALGIYVFNMAKSATSDNALSDVEKQQFNEPLKDFEGSKMGTMVINLIDKLVSNISQNKEADDRLPDVIYIDNRGNGPKKDAATQNNYGVKKVGSDGTIKNKAAEVSLTVNEDFFWIESKSGSVDDNGNTNLGKLRTKIANRHYYDISMTISPETGLVDYIFIKY